MDKYEYRVRAEEINALIEKREYAEAVKIADTIDWRRVKSVTMLCKVSELYKMNRRYEDSRDILLLAYERQPGSRKIVYSLCELSIKLEELVLAIEYYKEFVQVAPRDTGRFILQYRLYEAQEVSLEERIAVLEEYKKRDYREKWAYELAYLYHRVGLATRCVEECDELILWFGEGKYVIKAMELKMLHAPLTPIQQEKYDKRFQINTETEAAKAPAEPEKKEEPEVKEEPVKKEQLSVTTDTIPSMPIQIKAIDPSNLPTTRIPSKEISEGEVAEAEEEASYGQAFTAADVSIDMPKIPVAEVPDDLDIHVKTIDMGQYNTINLQKELAENLAKVMEQEDKEAMDATKPLPVDAINSYAAAIEPQQEQEPQEEQLDQEENARFESLDEVYFNNEEPAAEEPVPEPVEEEVPFQSLASYVGFEPVESSEPLEEIWHPQEFVSEEEETPVQEEVEEEPVPEPVEEEVPVVEEPQIETPASAFPSEEELLGSLGVEEEVEEAAPVSTFPSEEELLGSLGVEEEVEEAPASAFPSEEELLGSLGVEEEVEEAPASAFPSEEELLGSLGVEEEVEEEAPVSEPVEEEVPVAEEPQIETPASAFPSEEELLGSLGVEKEVEEAPASAFPSEEELLGSLGVEEEEEPAPEPVEEEVPVVEEPQIETPASAFPSEEELLGSLGVEEDVEEAAPVSAFPSEEELLGSLGVEEEVEEEAPVPEPVEEETPVAEAPQIEVFSFMGVPREETFVEEPQAEPEVQMPLEAEIPQEEHFAAETEDLEEDSVVNEQITGQLSFGDIMAEWEETKKATEAKHLEEMRRKVMAQTGPIFKNFDEETKALQTDLDVIAPSLNVFDAQETQETEEKSMPEFPSEEELLGSVSEEEASVVEEPVVEEVPVAEEPKPSSSVLNTAEIYGLEEKLISGVMTEAEKEPEHMPVFSSEPIGEPAPALVFPSQPMEEPQPEPVPVPEPTSAPLAEPIAEEPKIEQPPVQEPQPQAPAEQMGAALSKPTGDTEEFDKSLETLVLEALAETEKKKEEMAANPLTQDTGFIIADLTDLEETPPPKAKPAPSKVQKSMPVKRTLTRDEKELFGSIAQTKELQEEVANAIDNISLSPCIGNVIVTGERGTGTLTVAKNLVKVLSINDDNFSGKVAKISGEILNNKSIGDTINNLSDGALIIEQAGALDDMALLSLGNTLNKKIDTGILVILEDTRKEIDALLAKTNMPKHLFELRIDIAALDNDGLVNYGKEYANEKEYSIDAMGVLALYTRISEMQTNEHAVTVDEVREIVDEAIQKAGKKNVSHFVDILLAKRYDEEDMIVLREKDFLK